MHVILKYQTGRRTEGILLAASPGRMRIVVRRRTDTLEVRLIEGCWFCDDGEPIEVESWISDGCAGVAGLFSGLVPRTVTAYN
jgi:hypothetical protein